MKILHLSSKVTDCLSALAWLRLTVVLVTGLSVYIYSLMALMFLAKILSLLEMGFVLMKLSMCCTSNVLPDIKIVMPLTEVSGPKTAVFLR